MMNNEMNTMVLDNKELEQVNGGFVICLLVGFGIGVDACAISGVCGMTGTCMDDTVGIGANACIIYGAGVGFTLANPA